MRQFKFRGKDSNNSWHYGDLYPSQQLDDVMCILNSGDKIIIDSDTICQYTNHKTKNQRDVYEGDILFSEDSTDAGDIRVYCVVVYVHEVAGFMLLTTYEYEQYLMDGFKSATEHFASCCDFEFDTSMHYYAGNIFDNPELLCM